MKKQTYASVWDALEESRSRRQHAPACLSHDRRATPRRPSGLTQARAAKELSLTQPRLNDLLRGRIDKFSLDALVNMLARAGKQVTVKVRKAA